MHRTKIVSDICQCYVFSVSVMFILSVLCLFCQCYVYSVSVMFILSVLCLFSQLALTQSLDNVFHLFIVSVRMTTFSYPTYTTVNLCRVVHLHTLSLKKIFLSISS